YREALGIGGNRADPSMMAAIDGQATLLRDDLSNAEQRVGPESRAEVTAIRSDVENWLKLIRAPSDGGGRKAENEWRDINARFNRLVDAIWLEGFTYQARSTQAIEQSSQANLIAVCIMVGLTVGTLAIVGFSILRP